MSPPVCTYPCSSSTVTFPVFLFHSYIPLSLVPFHPFPLLPLLLSTFPPSPSPPSFFLPLVSPWALFQHFPSSHPYLNFPLSFISWPPYPALCTGSKICTKTKLNQTASRSHHKWALKMGWKWEVGGSWRQRRGCPWIWEEPCVSYPHPTCPQLFLFLPMITKFWKIWTVKILDIHLLCPHKFAAGKVRHS